jgi:hypothetical protein
MADDTSLLTNTHQIKYSKQKGRKRATRTGVMDVISASPSWLPSNDQWESALQPVDDSAPALCKWYRVYIRSLKAWDQQDRNRNKARRSKPSTGYIIRDAWRIVEHLRGRGENAFATLPRIPRTNDQESMSYADAADVLADVMSQIERAFASKRKNRQSKQPKLSAQNERQKQPKNRGRKVTHDPKEDKRIVEAWGTRRYSTYAELESTLRLNNGDVKRAIDRDRKRPAKRRNNSGRK